MKDSQNISIVLLTITAVVLGMMLVGISRTDTAWAGASVQHGDFIMATGSINAGRNLLYVVDSPQRQLNVYVYDDKRGSLKPLQNIDLERAFSRVD